MLRSNLIVIATIITAGLLLTEGQQYVPVQILVPANSSYPFYLNFTGYRPPYNYPAYVLNYTNFGYNFNKNGYNLTNYGNNSTKQNIIGPYFINQFPGYNVSVPTNYNSTQDGHLFVGFIQNNDKLLFNQTYRREKSWFGNRELTLAYPPGESNKFEIISAIRIYNRFLDGASCRAAIVNGGIGSQYVEINMRSNWRKGFLYNVQIFGH